MLSQNEYEYLLEELQAIPEKAEMILQEQSTVQKFASQNFNKSKVFYIGRLIDSASSMESALKLKEVSYMHSEAFAAGELKHGPIALIDTDTLVVAIATQSQLYEKINSNIVEVKSRGAATMVISQGDVGIFKDSADVIFTVPKVDDIFSSIISVIPAQLFAYYCSILKGIDPDKPKNLAKSVTVE